MAFITFSCNYLSSTKNAHGATEARSSAAALYWVHGGTREKEVQMTVEGRKTSFPKEMSPEG